MTASPTPPGATCREPVLHLLGCRSALAAAPSGIAQSGRTIVLPAALPAGTSVPRLSETLAQGAVPAQAVLRGWPAALRLADLVALARAGVLSIVCEGAAGPASRPRAVARWVVERLAAAAYHRLWTGRRRGWRMALAEAVAARRLHRGLRHLEHGSAAAPSAPPEIARGAIIWAVGTLSLGGTEARLVRTAAALHGMLPQPLRVLHGFPLDPPADHFFTALSAVAETGALPDLLAPSPAPALLAAAAGINAPDDQDGSIARWYQAIQACSPEVVHCWLDGINIRAGLAAVIARVPRVVLGIASMAPEHFAFLTPAMRPAYRWLLRQPGVVLAGNSAAGLADYQRWIGFAARETALIPAGLDLPQRVALPRRDGLWLGWAGRLSAEKRPLLWLEVAARLVRRLPDLRLVMLGDGPMRPTVAAEAERLGLCERLTLAGAVAAEAMAPALAGLDALLLTSVMEGLPNVLIEAQAQGVPVVATAVGGVPEALAPGVTGFAVADPGSATAWADALAAACYTALTDAPWRACAAAAGPALVAERFSNDALVAAMLRLYGLSQTAGVGTVSGGPA